MAVAFIRRSMSTIRPILLLGAVYLCVLLGSLLLPPARPTDVDVGAPQDSSVVYGMLAAETAPETGRTFRWTDPNEARIWTHGAERGLTILTLGIFGFVSEAQPTQAITLTQGVFSTGAVQVQAGWRSYHVLLPHASAWVPPTPVALIAERFRGPVNDSSERGVPLDYVALRFIPTELFPERTHLLAWVITLFGWLGWRITHLPTLGSRSQRVAQGLLFVAWFSGAALLLIADRLVPSMLAWLLPPMPWMLALATVVLIRTSPYLRQWPDVRRLQHRWIGAGLLALGGVLMFTQAAILPGFVLALFGMACLPDSPIRPSDQQHPNEHRWEYPVLLAIFVIALGLRLYDFPNLPYGLWRDEARHLMVAERILTEPDYRPIYIPTDGIDLPGLGLYPFALGLWVWGIEPWSARPITALAGALTVLPLYGLARNLFGRGSLALLAAVLLAVSSWHIAISRFTFPTVFDPLLQLTALWLISLAFLPVESQQRRRWLWLLLAGICLGLAAQTYHTGRLGLGFAVLLTLTLVWKHHEPQHRQLLGMARQWVAAVLVISIGALVSAGPLIGYALQNPEAFNQRVGAVSIFSSGALRGQAPLAALDSAVGRHVLAFNATGDQNGRHHAPYRPLLDLVTGLGFLVGIEFLLRRRDWRTVGVLGALLLGTLPSLLSVDSPHAMRAIDAVGFACLLAAFGWSRLIALFAARRGALTILAGTAICALALNVWTYFVLMPPDRTHWTAFYPVHTRIGAALREIATTRGPAALTQIYIPRGLSDNEVLVYLTLGLPVQTFEGTQLSAPAQPGALFFFSGYNYQRDSAPLIAALSLDPTPALLGPPLPDGSGPSWVAYRKRT